MTYAASLRAGEETLRFPFNHLELAALAKHLPTGATEVQKTQLTRCRPLSSAAPPPALPSARRPFRAAIELLVWQGRASFAAKPHCPISPVRAPSFLMSAIHRVADGRGADDYGALEPSISGKIMELHHKNHHNTYVTSYNNFSEQLASAQSSNDISAQIALLPLINFHGGGHINHTLFWENLAPKNSGGGEPPSGELASRIDAAYGSLDGFKGKMNAALAGIQGSGWAWLVQDTQTGGVLIKTYANQDPVVGQFRPLLGIDAWEHAY